MATAVMKDSPIVVMTLSIEEAFWLQGVLQNPPEGMDPDDEDLVNRERRRALYDALAGSK